MLILAGLVAAITLAGAPLESPSSEAAENFVRTCLATGGERSAVAETSRLDGWLPVETAPRDGVVWADGYSKGESVAALYLTEATEAPSDSAPGLPVILRPRQSHCGVAVRGADLAWREAAAVLDASTQLRAFPDALQPAEGAGRNGAVRYYGMIEQRVVVTIRQNPELGILEISVVRGLPHDAEQPADASEP